MLLDICAVGVGILLAPFLIRYSPRLNRRLNRRPIPPTTDLERRLLALDRGTRRDLAKRIRRGRAVPVEHAAIVVEWIDVANDAVAAMLSTSRRALYAFIVVWGAFIFALGWHLQSGSGGINRFLAFVLMSFVCSIGVLLIWRNVLEKQRLRAWRANSDKAREQAVHDLAATQPSENL
jgi:hypothetical protein